MKKRDIQELKLKPPAELEKKLKEHRDHLRQMQLDLAAGKVKNVGAQRTLRKDVARILTVQRENETKPNTTL